MYRAFVFISSLLFSLSSFSQYTETINSNRPGASQGAFAVGNGVMQLETGFRFDREEHDLERTETTVYGLDYQARYGFFMEKLELTLEGSFRSVNTDFVQGASTETLSYSNFQSNTIAGKYLIYDPYFKREQEEKSYISWKANNTFQWRDLIPAISAYAGINFAFGDNPFLFQGEPNFSPRLGLITQHNYGRWVFVTNFYGDKLGTDFPSYTGIFTLTHSVGNRFAVFGEFQTIIGDLYSDEIVRGGLAYLLTKNLQLDLLGLVNFKNTPQRLGFSLGISYRYDKFRKEERIYDESEKEQLKSDDNFKLGDKK